MVTGLYYTLWALSIAAEITFLARLLRSGLAVHHAFFFWWAAIDVASSLLGIWFATSSLYINIYFANQAILVTLQFLAIRRIFSERMVQYPGIGIFGRNLLIGITAVSAVIAVLVMNSDWLRANTPADQIMAASRVITSGFAFFLLGGMLFFYRFSMPTPRNILTLENGCLLYFAVQTFALFLMVTVGSAIYMGASVATLIVTLAVFAYWSVAIKREREVIPPESPYDPEEHTRIEKLNEDALRLARSIRASASRR